MRAVESKGRPRAIRTTNDLQGVFCRAVLQLNCSGEVWPQGRETGERLLPTLLLPPTPTPAPAPTTATTTAPTTDRKKTA